jgi:hypothetical protein
MQGGTAQYLPMPLLQQGEGRIFKAPGRNGANPLGRDQSTSHTAQLAEGGAGLLLGLFG